MGVFLGITQDFRIEHVDLQRTAAVFTVAPQEGFKFIFVLGISDNRRVKRDGMTGAVGKAIEISPPITEAIGRLAAQYLSN